MLIGFMFAGCSVLKKDISRSNQISEEKPDGDLFERIGRNNITEKGFIIQSADVEIIKNGEVQKATISVKFEVPDKYLISIRNQTGIEGARILLSSDTILLNDRIDRIQYYGSAGYFEKRYGFPVSVLPLIFGDIIADSRKLTELPDCKDNRTAVHYYIKGISLAYNIDCNLGKTISATYENSSNNLKVEITYGNFIETGDIIVPGSIKIHGSNKVDNINIDIKKIESPWKGSMEFIPGSNYELIELI